MSRVFRAVFLIIVNRTESSVRTQCSLFTKAVKLCHRPSTDNFGELCHSFLWEINSNGGRQDPASSTLCFRHQVCHYNSEQRVTALPCRFLTPPVSPSLGSRRLKARPTWTPPLSPSNLRSRRTRPPEEAAAPASPRSSGDDDHLSVFPYLESDKKKFLMAAASNNVRRFK